MSEKLKKKRVEKTKTISIPIHPDDKDVPVSLVHVPLSKGRYATICGPLGYKTLCALQGTLLACKDSLVAQPKKVKNVPSSGPPISTSPLETEGSEANKRIASVGGPDSTPHSSADTAPANPPD